ncbi:glutaredoxin family protein [Leucobacter sp. HNU]|uniref:glutaredoxin family protein n=1 Tax=Leucobacter sp. HNU TaxID=3236805 RepID=UPI003A8027E7
MPPVRRRASGGRDRAVRDRGAGIATELEELDILQDAELARRHSEDIPVVFVNDRRVAIWRVDPAKLTAAIERAANGPKFALFRR